VRNFFPSLSMLAADLAEKGILELGEYAIIVAR